MAAFIDGKIKLISTILGLTLGIFICIFPFISSGLVAIFLFLGFFVMTGKTVFKTHFIICGYWVALCLQSTIFARSATDIYGLFFPIYVLLMVVMIYNVFQKEYLNAKMTYYVIIINLMFWAVIFSNLINIEYVPEFMIDRKLFPFVFAVLTYFQLPNRRAVETLFNAQIISTLIIVLWVCYYNFIFYRIAERGGVYVNQNYVATLISFGIIPLFIRVKINSMDWIRKVFGWLFTFLALYSVFILGSRGVSLALFIALIFILLYKEPNKSYMGNIKSIVFVAVGVLIVFQLPGSENLFNRFTGGDVGSFNSRLPIWSHALEEFFSKSNFYEIFIGHGVGYSESIVRAVVPALTSTHNAYILILIDYGVVGLTIFLMMHLIPLIYSFLKNKSQFIYVASFCVFLFMINLTADVPEDYLYWVILGQLFAISNVEEAI